MSSWSCEVTGCLCYKLIHFITIFGKSRDQQLKVPEGDREVKCTVVGVDEFGYLRVVSEEGGEIVLHPNGNSIDMMAGSVIPRGTR